MSKALVTSQRQRLADTLLTKRRNDYAIHPIPKGMGFLTFFLVIINANDGNYNHDGSAPTDMCSIMLVYSLT